MSSENEFAGKKWLVTGASRGIGKAVVAELHARGAIVYALARNPENLNTLVKQFPNVIPICVDLSNLDDTRKALEPLEPINVLVNNAGVNILTEFMGITEETCDQHLNVNLKAVINVSQIIVKKMISSGVGGSIVNIGSVVSFWEGGKKPFAINPIYCCTISALEMLTRAMAIQFGPNQIRVKCVNPEAVDTDMMTQTLEKISEKNNITGEEYMVAVRSRTPTGAEFVPMGEVVNTILFMASDLTTQITGGCLAVDGGFLVD